MEAGSSGIEAGGQGAPGGGQGAGEGRPGRHHPAPGAAPRPAAADLHKPVLAGQRWSVEVWCLPPAVSF